MSDTRLKSIYSRWLRLEEAKQEISDDLKELFKEAKGDGYDGKAIRAAFRKVAKLEGDKAEEIREQDALVDLYIDALTRDAREAGSYAEVTGREPVDAKLIETVVKGVQTEIGRKALVVALDAMIEAEGDEPVQEMHELPEGAETHEQPETANETRGGLPVAAASGTAEETGRTPAYTRMGRSGTPTVAGVTAGETATISDDDVPAFIKRDRKPLRPNCLNPDLCAGSGRDHCHACKKAMAEVEAA